MLDLGNSYIAELIACISLKKQLRYVVRPLTSPIKGHLTHPVLLTDVIFTESSYIKY